MEAFFDVVGVLALIIMALVGAGVGWIVGKTSRGSTGLYMLIGVLAAVSAPFLLAALGLSVVAAGGVILLVIMSGVVALIILGIARAILR
ncbi:GlsB/YeaQ/YmgE family stress response membrane protein [Lutimaribacter marinistellae]|uniref:GlsB/YeaQ/YmgE family stress response membrane protein n=1 Tax=Lutimaribacter marinistellae TaxID=1820329 RepID=A0ABV7TJQ7_9RHOB